MNMKMNMNKSELLKLIHQQRKNRESRYVFSERITPRRSILFPMLTLRQKACLILSFFMKHREIAEVLKVTQGSVEAHLKRSRIKLLLGDLSEGTFLKVTPLD